jgi:hypothetical protein
LAQFHLTIFRDILYFNIMVPGSSSFIPVTGRACYTSRDQLVKVQAKFVIPVRLSASFSPKAAAMLIPAHTTCCNNVFTVCSSLVRDGLNKYTHRTNSMHFLSSIFRDRTAYCVNLAAETSHA